jgi:hypothetical protein
MRPILPLSSLPALVLLVGGCSTDALAPAPAASATPAFAGTAGGPETPNFNLEVVLRGDGFGLVKFRQPKDDQAVVQLDAWVRDLAPNSEYLLQRAVDAVVDDECTSTDWLTLGAGLQPRSIVTDARGTGRARLSRDLSAVPPGTEFDIHFRVVDARTLAIVLQSECYQFRISL